MHFPLPRRWLGRSFIAGVLVAAGLTVTACGSSGHPTTLTTATILNTEKIERAIEHSSLAQRGQYAQVSCPSGVHQRNGLVFTCTAVVGRNSTRFVVTETDGSGHVHYEAR
jgi:hypothetical protein